MTRRSPALQPRGGLRPADTRAMRSALLPAVPTANIGFINARVSICISDEGDLGLRIEGPDAHFDIPFSEATLKRLKRETATVKRARAALGSISLARAERTLAGA